MTLAQINALLNTTGYPVTYSHFKEVPTIPYITYLEVGANYGGADLKVLTKDVDIDIELYTAIKDLTAEEKIEKVLIDNNIPFQKTTTYINTEELFQITYSVNFFEKL